MRMLICVTAALLVCACTSGQAPAAVTVPEGFTASALGQNFMGGLDYLPNGDLIGMWGDPLYAANSWIGIADANGDGIPAGEEKVYDFGLPEWAGFVKVSPDGETAVFCESTYYKIYEMDLSTLAVREIVPQGGAFGGAFDLAFADDSSCYVSANPGAFPATTNKILHLDLASGKVTEVASIGGTYGGPIDVDDEGNLFYVKGKAHFPVQPGDFTLLKFDASELAGALESGAVLTPADAAVVRDGLDGGYDVAWHAASGDLFVSDANHGKIYRIGPGGLESEFASFPGNDGEGFRVISFFMPEEPFVAGARSECVLATDYLPLAGASVPNVYLVEALPPLVDAVVNSTILSAGSRLALTVTAQPQAVPFDGYVVLAGPGAAYSVTANGLSAGVAPYAPAVPALASEFKARVLDMTVPPAAAGAWTVYSGLVPAGAPPSPAAAIALDTVGVVVR